MPGLIPAIIEDYIQKYTSAEDELLKEVADATYAHHPKSHMLSGHVQGRFLEMISCMIRPQNILEIGTFTGYSALCLCRGLAPGGMLHTVELREAEAATAQGYFNRSPQAAQIKLHTGDAWQLIGEMDIAWDLVFIDADKEGYTDYFNLVLPKLKLNGFILADNVLFHGQVLTDEIRGKSAKAIQAFNDYIRGRADVVKVMLPLRDGMYLIRKVQH